MGYACGRQLIDFFGDDDELHRILSQPAATDSDSSGDHDGEVDDEAPLTLSPCTTQLTGAPYTLGI
jgi:hypothetical protein